jgi:hypothetical protein
VSVVIITIVLKTIKTECFLKQTALARSDLAFELQEKESLKRPCSRRVNITIIPRATDHEDAQ